jgi:predicted enzyme related to lactoylglutathione lyase
MANPPGSFIWYELMTTDADAAAKFYGAVVGWKISPRAGEASAGARDYRHIARTDGGGAGGVLQLTDEMCAHGARTTWLGYLHVKNVDAATAAIEADGGHLVMPKMALPVGDIAMITDPLGTPLYVMSPIPPADKPDAVSDVFHPRAQQHINWNELATPDLARAKAFYSRHFGFEFNEVMPMGPLGEYCFIDHGSQRLGGMMQKPPQDPLGGWVFYFGVPSALAAHRAILAGGGRVLREPHEVPGGGWIVVATDPQGAVFGITGPKGE